MKASACMMTPEPKQRLTKMAGRLTPASVQPTRLVLFFDGLGTRRVHYSVRTNRHLVKIKKRWREVNIDTLTTVEPGDA